MNNKHCIKIIASPFLLFGGIILLTLSVCLCAFIIILLNDPSFTKSSSDKLIAQLFFAFLGISMVVACVSCSDRWFVRIKLTKSSIVYHTIFKKIVEKPYKTYPYISFAQHSIGGLHPFRYRIICIVLSDRMLTSYEKDHINHVKITDSMITIQYNKKIYEKLHSILPEKQRHILKIQHDQFLQEENKKFYF